MTKHIHRDVSTRNPPGSICFMAPNQPSTVENLTPYKSNAQFLEALNQVLEKDYGTSLSYPKLREAGESLTLLFKKCL